MKVYLMTISIVILLIFMSLFRIQNNTYLYEYEKLKSKAEDLSHAAALYYDENEYSKGKYVFNHIEGNKVTTHLSQYISNYWQEEAEVFVYYYDDSGFYRKYKDGTLLEETAFSYPIMFEEELTSYSHYIVKPTVVVTINAGIGNFSRTFEKAPKGIRTSAYEIGGY